MSLIRELIPTSRQARWMLACILLLALGLRLGGLYWGLPGTEFYFPLHPDEWVNIKSPRDMVMTGDLNPHFFNYGSLHSYLTWLVFLVARPLGWLPTPASWFVAARLPVILMGVLSAWLLLPIGRRVGGEKLGLLAAFVLAVSPGHVLHSGFYTVDIPSIFFATLGLWFALILLDTGSLRWLAASAFAVGLAAATKYPMGMSLFCPLAALVLRARLVDGSGWDWPWLTRGVLLAGAVSLLAFLIGVPYALLDFPAFWKDMSYELFEHAMDGHRSLFAATGNGLVYLFTVNLLYSLGATVLVGGALGLLGLLHREREKGIVLLSFVVPYVIVLGFAKLRFMRYTLALTPFFALGLAWLTLFLLSRAPVLGQPVRPGRRSATLPRLLRACALLLVFGWPLLLSSLQFRSLLRIDPRVAAARWAKAHIPAGQSIGMMDHPNWYAAPLSPFNRGNPASFYKDEQRHAWDFSLLVFWDARRLRKQSPEWFVMSEFMWSHQLELGTPAAREVLEMLDRDYELVASFESFPTSERWLFGHPHPPHDWLYPFPAQRIWKRRAPLLTPPR